MGAFNIWHWLIILILYLIFIWIPTAKIMQNAGYSRAWAFVYIIPFINLVALWVFAFSKWPALRR